MLDVYLVNRLVFAYLENHNSLHAKCKQRNFQSHPLKTSVILDWLLSKAMLMIISQEYLSSTSFVLRQNVQDWTKSLPVDQLGYISHTVVPAWRTKAQTIISKHQQSCRKSTMILTYTVILVNETSAEFNLACPGCTVYVFCLAHWCWKSTVFSNSWNSNNLYIWCHK